MSFSSESIMANGGVRVSLLTPRVGCIGYRVSSMGDNRKIDCEQVVRDFNVGRISPLAKETTPTMGPYPGEKSENRAHLLQKLSVKSGSLRKPLVLTSMSRF